MKVWKKAVVLASILALMGSLFTGCGQTEPEQTQPAAQDQADKTLVVGAQSFDGKFSPFFYTNQEEGNVLELIHVPLFGADREGAMVLQGIHGEVRPYNGTDYLYTGIADCAITDSNDGRVTYDITLKEGVRFSDGEQMDIDDVIFTMYVLLDPTYDGTSTFYSLPIEGLEAYRSGMQTRMELILQVGPGNYSQTEHYTQQQYDRFWEAFYRAGARFAQQIVDYCVAQGEADSTSSAAAAWGYGGLPENAVAEDFFQRIVERFGYDITDAGINQESAGADIAALIDEELAEEVEDFHTGIQTGVSAARVSGIQRTGDYSMRLVLTEKNAAAVHQLGIAVAPLHYYGQEMLYDYEADSFGFPKGDLARVRAVTTAPMGAGPYQFVSYRSGIVTLQANEIYWKGVPQIRHIQFKEGQEADKVSGVIAGTLDITDPSYSTETAKAIAQANGGSITGDVITTNMVSNLGYGYVGFSAKNVCVDGQSGSEASKNLRKAIATVIAVYRDVAVDSYYGEFANVVNYPISDTSWAAPRVTDEGYQVAFSVDVHGEPIYTGDMTPQQRYEAAKEAALGFFAAAGYTVEDGRVKAAPAGAQMEYEVLVGGGGTGDHPTFMALTQASEALAQIGFSLIVTDLSNFSELSNAVNSGTAELFAMAWQATADPDMFQIYHSQGGSNEKAYWIKDETLDELIMMARQSMDQTYRKTLYRECLQIVADWAVEIPVYQRQNVIIFSTQRVDMDTVTPDMTTFWDWRNDIERLQMRADA